MPLRRTIILATMLALISIPAVSLLSGCDSKPDTPAYDNPFDPNGPNAGDPFNLVATLGDTTISLIWDQPQGYNLVTYEVMHSTNMFEEFFSVGSVEANALDTAFFTYDNPEPTTTHYFKIQAFDAAGNFTLISHIVPASATVLSRVVVNDGSRTVASRNLNLQISVSNGDSLRISQAGHPDSETVLAADISGTPVSLPWDLGPADNNDTTMTLHVVVQFGTNLGDTNKVELEIDFSPRLALAQGGNRVASLTPLLSIEPEGLVFMRFASSQEDLAAMPWLPGADTHDQYQLMNTANNQTIFAEFLGDFGFSIFQQLNVIPDLLLDPSFHLTLPNDHITDESTVQGISSANATLMRFSESLDFSSVPWIAYSDTTLITLSPEPGEKIIYAQYRNDFAESPILTDYVIHIIQSVEVAITAPAEADMVLGGSFLLVQGTATSPSGTARVDSVMFDGGSGFEIVEGTDNWSLNWEIPRFETDTNLIIRARAWADGDSVTTALNLVVTQLMVGISSPAEGDTVISDTDVEISGFSQAATGGAAVDSVTVTIDDETMVAVGTNSWTFDWHPDAVAEEVETVITATVHAGVGQYSVSKNIFVVPQ